MMRKIKFTIYIAALNTSNKETIKMFEKACAKMLEKQSFTVHVVDILKNPGVAEKKKILAIPTVVRDHPDPEKRIIGEIKEDVNAESAVEFLISDLEL